MEPNQFFSPKNFEKQDEEISLLTTEELIEINTENLNEQIKYPEEKKENKKENKEIKKEKKEKKEKKKKEKTSILTDLRLMVVLIFPYFKSSSKFIQFSLVVSILLLIFNKLLTVGVPLIFKKIIDEYTETSHISTNILIVYVLFKSISGFLLDFKDNIFLWVTNDVSGKMMKSAFSKIHDLGLRFHIKHKPGELTRIMEKGLAATPLLLNLILFSIAPALLETFFVLIILLFYFSWKFLFAPFVCLILYIGWTIFMTEKQRKIRKQMNEKDNVVSGEMLDSFINFEIIKCFVQEKEESLRYEDLLFNYFKSSEKAQKITSLLSFGQTFIIGLCLFISLLLGGNELSKNEISLGDFVALNAYILQLWTPLASLSKSYRGINRSLASLEKVDDLFKKKNEIEDDPSSENLVLKKNEDVSIKFNNVSFSYEQDENQIENLSFTMKGGTTTALIGSSGSGKSTISKLICKFYHPNSGNILINDIDLKKLKSDSVRNHIGIVPQDTILFSGSIFRNVSFGTKNATLEMVQEACKKASIHNFILTCPNGYETQVGQRGLRLSGGQRQRISLARLFLKNPKILILDEATSSLDHSTEQEIQKSILDLSEGRTVLKIAHDLNFIKDSDNILILESGCLVDQGSHENLLKNSKVYQKMCENLK